MIFQGDSINVSIDDDNIATLLFDAKSQSVNKFDSKTLEEFRNGLSSLLTQKAVKGLIIASTKDTFIVGADITQFDQLFGGDEAAVFNTIISLNQPFNTLEDLPFPTVSIVDGIALGGGLELAMSTDFRILSPKARVGLPEVKLGICPGFGGTVRLPRLIGVDNAVEWIATGKEHKAQAALDVGLADAIVASENLFSAAKKMINDAIEGKFSIQKIRQQKTSPVAINDMERLMAFTTAKGLVAQQAGPNMPAPLTAVKSIEKSCGLARDEAIKIEAKYFARLAKTDVSDCLVSLFLNEQDLSKRNRKATKNSQTKKILGVLGAGIMGGGIAYQSANKGKKHVIMKDVAQAGLDQGMAEATQLLAKAVSRKRLTTEKMAECIARISPQLDYSHFETVDVVVEAVVEKLAVKQMVLSEVEAIVKEDAIIASNTSTLSISKMAEGLQRPAKFCGMHFFNPVPRMPLVEVIRGEKTSEETIDDVVKLALDMGKTPIVVNDCPGFYVNRVLFPYLNSFNLLIRDGADLKQVDKVMEKFGWPMGPAYLIDVVGIDTGVHAANVMAEGFPDRMDKPSGSAMQILFDADYLGQKNKKGFYQYALDKKGKLKKQFDESVLALIKPAVTQQLTFDEETILERMMIPMCFEVIRCLEENIVASTVDADLGLIMGLGFPVFRGGPVKYMESIGLDHLLKMAEKYHHLGNAYKAPQLLLDLVRDGATTINTIGG